MHLSKPRHIARLNKSHPLAKDLVGCWLMNEGTGFTVYDISGNNNHGDMASDLIWKEGGIYFDDFSTGINIPLSDSLTLASNDPVTVFQVVDTRTYNQYNDTGFNLDGTIAFRIEAYDLEFGLIGFTTGGYCHDPDVAPNADHLPVLGTYDGTNIKLFVDGVKKQTTTPTGSYTASTLDAYIGTRSGSGSFSWVGNIYVTYIWKRGLTDEEAASISADPYQIFESDFDFSFLQAVGAGVTVDVTLGALALSSYTTEIPHTTNVDLAAITLSPFVTSVPHTVNTSVETTTLSGFDAAVTLFDTLIIISEEKKYSLINTDVTNQSTISTDILCKL